MEKKTFVLLAAMAMSGAVAAQTLISMPAPVRPGGLFSTEFGIVQIAADISAEGQIVDLHIHKTSGLQPFDMKALAAVSAAKFSPKKGEDGKPMAGTVVVPVQFGVPPGKTQERLCRSWSGEMRDFTTYQPQRSLDELKSVAEIKSLLVNGHFSKGNAKSNLKDRSARLPEVFERIVSYCSNETTGRVGEIVDFVVEDFKY